MWGYCNLMVPISALIDFHALRRRRHFVLLFYCAIDSISPIRYFSAHLNFVSLS